MGNATGSDSAQASSPEVSPEDHASTTKQRLLEVAIEAVDRGGESSVRVIEVAKAAGVSTSSLYHYFGSRDGLIIATQLARYQMYDEANEAWRFLETCGSKEEWREFMVGLFRSLTSEESRRRRRRRIEILGSSVSRPELREAITLAYVAVVDQLEEVFAEVERRGYSEGRLSPLEMAEWLNGLMLGRYQTEATGDERRIAARDRALEVHIRDLFS